MTAPIDLSFEVACSVDHAFATWTGRIGAWWPRDHTVSGRPDAVVLEEGPGGRIYERAAGAEHVWGHVTLWEPPHRLGYLWHIGRDPVDATEVEITFVPLGDRATRVEIAHRGWERLGGSAETWRDRNQRNWQTLIPHYVAAVQKGELV